MTLKLGIIGIDHGHIFGMLSNMKAQGCTCDHYWTNGLAVTEAKFNQVFPEVTKVADRRAILDSDADMILISAIPEDRAGFAIEAMEAGKDVMVDKPGCTTLDQLDQIKAEYPWLIFAIHFHQKFTQDPLESLVSD